MKRIRFPAEHSPHHATIAMLPFRNDIWRNNARNMQRYVLDLAKTVSEFELVYLIYDERCEISEQELQHKNVIPLKMKYDDIWARDISPTFVYIDGELSCLNWKFNAWGGLVDGLYFPWDQDDKIAMKMKEPESDTNMTIIITDNVMYMLDDATKTGYSMEADESMLEEYNLEEILGELNIDEEIDDAEDVMVCGVKVDGEVYTFEVAETGGGFLYDSKDKLCAIIADDDDTVLKVNEFNADAPDDIFEVPSDYEVIDMASLLG